MQQKLDLSEKLSIIAIIVFFVYLLARAVLFFWHHPIYFGIFAAIVITITALIFLEIKNHKKQHKIEARRREREGWWVDRIAHHEGNEFTYHDESENDITFLCEYGPKAGVLFVPTPEEWQQVMPDWAKGRRDLILARLKQKAPVEIEESHGEFRSHFWIP